MYSLWRFKKKKAHICSFIYICSGWTSSSMQLIMPENTINSIFKITYTAICFPNVSKLLNLFLILTSLPSCRNYFLTAHWVLVTSTSSTNVSSFHSSFTWTHTHTSTCLLSLPIPTIQLVFPTPISSNPGSKLYLWYTLLDILFCHLNNGQFCNSSCIISYICILYSLFIPLHAL